MKYFAYALCLVAFFGLIAASIYWLKSSGPLWALLLTPSFFEEKA